jgi:hypothetical protein
MWNICNIFTKFKKEEEIPLEIKDMTSVLPWHETRVWANRAFNRINKIIIHQALVSGATAESVNNYHITPGENNHISPNGAPHICYHYVIEKDGSVLLCNNLSSIVWHCKGQNTSSIGILVMGDFNGVDHSGMDSHPTKEQLHSLKQLLNTLLKNEKLDLDETEIYGHDSFGKPACPGYILINFIKNFIFS